MVSTATTLGEAMLPLRQRCQQRTAIARDLERLQRLLLRFSTKNQAQAKKRRPQDLQIAQRTTTCESPYRCQQQEHAATAGHSLPTPLVSTEGAWVEQLAIAKNIRPGGRCGSTPGRAIEVNASGVSPKCPHGIDRSSALYPAMNTRMNTEQSDGR